MRQEYVTSRGAIILENNIILIRKKISGIQYRVFFEIFIPIFFIARFILKLMEEPSPSRNVGIIFLGFLSLLSVGPLLYNLFRRSYANRIDIRSIQSFKTEDDNNGLEVRLILRLSSGRERIISFRKRENQLESFIAALTCYEISMEPA